MSRNLQSRLKLCVCAAFAATAMLGAFREARAVVLAYEGFNYAPGLLVNAEGVGLGTAGNGWAGAWDTTQGANPTDLTNIQAGSLGYTDALGNALTTTGGKLINTGEMGTSQPGRTLQNRRDGVTLGATATTPVPTWISFLAIRTGALREPGATPSLRDNTYPRGANFSLFDSTLGAAANEEKLNIGENSNFEYPLVTGADFLRLQRAEPVDPAQLDLFKAKYGKSSTLAVQGSDFWMVNAPRVQTGITAAAAPGFEDPVDGTITANIDWQRNPVNGRFGMQFSKTPFGGQVSLVLARIDHFGGDAPRDKLTMWMNPNLNAAPSDANASIVIDLAAIETRANSLTAPVSPAFNTTSGNLFSFDRIRFFAGNLQAGTPDTPFAEWSFDELRFGEAFGDVTPHGAGAGSIPEPGAMTLAAIALAAASWGRRRAGLNSAVSA